MFPTMQCSFETFLSDFLRFFQNAAKNIPPPGLWKCIRAFIIFNKKDAPA